VLVDLVLVQSRGQTLAPLAGRSAHTPLPRPLLPAMQSEDYVIYQPAELDVVVIQSERVVESIAVVDVPVLGQRCVDSVTVDCAALEAASGY